MANEDDVFEYSQNDFLCTSFAAFEDMRKKGHLCDLTIKVQNLSFSAHRVILSAGIPFLDSVLIGLEMADKEFTVVENVDPKALELLINFAYTGKVTISSENVQSLLAAAQFLQLSQVQNACLSFLSKENKSENIENASTLSCAVNNNGVLRSSNAYIRENFEEFSEGEEFLSLPFECVKEIISRDDLNVSSEEIVFEALIKWVKGSPFERQGMLPELLGETRLTYLSVEYLIERVESEELVMSSKGCRDLVKETKYCRMIPERTPAASNLKMYPRNCLKKDVYAISACSACDSYVYRYDLHKAKWHILSSAEVKYCKSSSSHWNKTVVVNQKIYTFLEKGINICDIKTLEWDFLSVSHEAKEGTTFVSFENMIYYFYWSSPVTGNMVCFDTQQNEIVKKTGTPKTWAYAAAATLENSIYVTGGSFTDVWEYNSVRNVYQYVTKGSSCDVAKYMPSTDKWSNVAPMLVKRSHHCCTSLNKKIYVCGNQGTEESRRVEVYDPLTNQWNFLAFLDSMSNYISLVSDHDKLYAITEQIVEIYDTRTRRWKSSKVPKCLVGVVSVPNQVAIDANETGDEKTVEKEVEKAVE